MLFIFKTLRQRFELAGDKLPVIRAQTQWRQIDMHALRVTQAQGFFGFGFASFDGVGFDTAVNAHLIEQGALDIHHGETIGLVIETQCNYFAPLAFPQTIEAGIRVAKLGSSSVRYEIGLFAQDEDLCAARGHFVHVYVDKENRRPVKALPLKLKTVLETLV
jgi:acyl-CoA thioester hydrolase